MANDELDDIQSEMNTEVLDGRKDPARYDGEDLSQKTVVEARVKASPMRALKWCGDKTNFYFEVYFELTESDGTQGLRVYKKSDDSLVRDIRVPMGGGDTGQAQNQIYINNRTIITLLVQQILSKSNDLDALEAAMLAAISTGRSNPIGYSGENTAGLSPAQANFSRSPCRTLNWLNSNSPYGFISFTQLRADGGEQGLKIYSDDTGQLVKTFSVPVGGGKNADPRKSIYKNNRKILMTAVNVVWKKIQNGGW